MYSRTYMMLLTERFTFVGDDSQSLPVSSQELTELFSSISDTLQQNLPGEYVCNIFDKKGITLIGNEIKCLSKEVPVIRDPKIFQRRKGFRPGALIILEVEVTFQNGELKITEQVIFIIWYK